MENVNDVDKWKAFVKKLIDLTNSGRLEWRVQPDVHRDRMSSRFFMTEVATGRYVGIYAYKYDYSDGWERSKTLEEIQIELVDEKGDRLWHLPAVAGRGELFDLVSFNEADAEETLRAVLDAEAV
jgi:hypothetical protein